MARVPAVTREDLPEAQQPIYDRITESRGRVSGPFRVLLHVPEVAGRAAHLGSYLRFEGDLPPAVRELGILASAREHHCQYEWTAHDPAARAAGVRPEAIAAVRDGAGLDALAEEEALVVAYVRELLREKRVSAATYQRAVAHWGERGLVELTALVGYYSMLACVLNAFEVRPEEDGRAPLLPE